jgi:hypothetical protein
MKKIIFALLAILLLGAFAAPKNKRGVRCMKQSAKFVVDGKTTEWKIDSLRFDNKTGFAYAFSNNDKDLFVQLKMLNTSVQRKALIAGLTLWIDPNGKGKHVLGIKYPKGRMHQQEKHKPGQGNYGQNGHRRPASGGHLTAEQISRFNSRYGMEQPVLEGFEKAGIKNVSTGEKGIRVVLQIDTLGHVVYEAKIPLKMIFTKPADYLSKGRPFSILFETGYLQMDMSHMQGRGGMGGRQGQGMGGGGQRPNPSQMSFMQGMAEASHLKLKTVRLFQEK